MTRSRRAIETPRPQPIQHLLYAGRPTPASRVHAQPPRCVSGCPPVPLLQRSPGARGRPPSVGPRRRSSSSTPPSRRCRALRSTLPRRLRTVRPPCHCDRGEWRSLGGRRLALRARSRRSRRGRRSRSLIPRQRREQCQPRHPFINPRRRQGRQRRSRGRPPLRRPRSKRRWTDRGRQTRSTNCWRSDSPRPVQRSRISRSSPTLTRRSLD